MLFLFATYDSASQLALIPLSQFLKAHPELRALGIATQPNPEQLLPLYAESLDVGFPLAYEPDNRIVAGHSILGSIETVPTYIVLDADGVERARHTGAASETQLESLTEAVR